MHGDGAWVGGAVSEMYLKIWTKSSPSPPTPLSMRMILRFHYYGTLQLTLNRRTAARLLSFGCGAARRTNTRPKAPIDSQSDGGRGGPVAAFSHLVSLCARKNGSVYYERGGAGALSVRERMRMEARGREGMKGDDTRRETRI